MGSEMCIRDSCKRGANFYRLHYSEKQKRLFIKFFDDLPIMVSRGSGFLGIKRAGGMSLITNSAIEVEDHEMRTMLNLAVIASTSDG